MKKFSDSYLLVALVVSIATAMGCVREDDHDSGRRAPEITSVYPDAGDLLGGESIVIVTRHFKNDFTVDPLDGDIRIFYDDRRNDSDMDGTGPDKENERISVYMAGSTDAGASWAYEAEVRSKFDCPPGLRDLGFRADTFIGDYIGAASRLGSPEVNGAWTDRRTEILGQFQDEIWSARRSDP